MADAPLQVLGRALADTRANDTGATSVYSGTEIVGFEEINSHDWKDFTLFRVEENTTTLDITLAADADINTAHVWAKNISSITGAIRLYYESAPAVFTLLASFGTALEDGVPQWKEFSRVTVLNGRKVRWEFIVTGGTADIRQLTAGIQLMAPRGQRGGVKPPTLQSGIIVNNVIAVNGSIIDRSVRRLDRDYNINWDFVSEQFVRTEWEDFAVHMTTKACIYAWDYDNYPDEIVFASAESIIPPLNMDIPQFMAVSMPLKVLS